MAKDEQISKHFRMSEFACHDQARTPVPERYKANVRKLVLTILQPLRDWLEIPIFITSGYRTAAYNKHCGGVKRSLHMKAMAADIAVRTMSPREVADAVLIAMNYPDFFAFHLPDGGLGRYPGFTHIDIGAPRRWGSN